MAQLFQGEAGASIQAAAEEFLRDRLAVGSVPAGFSESTLKRAKEDLGIRARFDGRPGESSAWCWRIREATEKAQDPENRASGVTSCVM